MKRAAVLIGVDKTGTLPKLKDAAKGAERMAKWARDQKMDAVHVITDAAGPVDVASIKKVIRELVDAGNISQLLVYFAGHGVNLQRQEFWLLTDAPDDTQAAVNVAGSAGLAATCGIPHIVFISDACRTAAEGILAQSVTGSEIFPNREGNETPVDLFFACGLGRPSHEVKDPKVMSAEFSALYTDELVPALNGERAEIVVNAGTGEKKVGHVHLRPLRDHLASAVANRIKNLQLQTNVIQVPIAKINSDPPLWLSTVKASRNKRGGLGFEIGRPAGAAKPVVKPAPTIAEKVAAVQSELTGAPVLASGEELSPVARLAKPFGVTHHETECGFKIRGARIVRVKSHDTKTDLNAAGNDVRVRIQNRPVNILLVLDSGAGALLPAIPGFITALTVEDGELVDVGYEPSDNSNRWSDFQGRAEEIRALRSIIASSMTQGAFHLEGDDALEIARRMQYSKGIDPSLAVYAAYAYHDLQRKDLINEMANYLATDLGAPLFDVALLARGLDKRVADNGIVISPIPLLGQGWALLNAFRVTLVPALKGIEGHIISSLWTLLDAKGVKQVEKALASGAIR